MTTDTPQPGNKAINFWLVWKLEILYLAILCFVSGGGQFLGAMQDQQWSDLRGDQKFAMILGILMTQATLVGAFVHKTASGLAQGKFLPPDLDPGTGQWQRRITTSDVTTAQGSGPVAAPPVAPLPPKPDGD